VAEELPRCPQCGITAFDSLGGEALRCRHCGTEFDLRTDLCPYCRFLNLPGQRFCAQCGGGLTSDAVDQMLSDRLRTAGQWRGERQQVVRRLVARDQLASQLRMEALQRQEQERLEAERRAADAARERERQMFIIGGGVVLFFIVVGAALVWLFTLWLPQCG
jgi:hypothetical protein